MNWKKVVLHATPWLFQVVISMLLYNLGEEVDATDFFRWLPMTLLAQMTIFYGYYYSIVPDYLGKRNRVFWAWTIGILLFYPVIKYGWDSLIGAKSIAVIIVNIESENENEHVTHTTWLVEYFRRFFTPLFYIPMAVFVRFSVDWFRNYRRQVELESQNLKSELALLRNQINPHFLFNTLNNIDSMVYKVAPKASDAIVKLSELMRYMLYDASTDEVRLSQEIQHLRSFIDLQKLRLKQHDIHFSVNVDTEHIKVAPMLFIPFVENAFKHGQWTEESFNVQVALSGNANELVFKVINYFDKINVEEKDKTGGIGLSNVIRRLELLYPDRHYLDITQENNQFVVTLRLNP